MANMDRQKDQEMAQRLKAEGVERWTQRCPTCYQIIPNGMFFEAKHMTHIVSCPGPKTAKGSNGRV